MVIDRLSLLHGSMDPCNQAIKNQTKISFRHTMIFYVTTGLNADILTCIWLLAKHEDHQMQILGRYLTCISLPASGSVIARLATHSPAVMAGRYCSYFNPHVLGFEFLMAELVFFVIYIFILVWFTTDKSLYSCVLNSTRVHSRYNPKS